MKERKSYSWGCEIFALGSVALATGFTLLTPTLAQAQAAYGSYLGAGFAFGVTNQNAVPNEDRNSSGFFSVRYKFLRAPVSLRTQVLVGGNGIAVVPTVSYDIPLNWQADAYIGAGASIVRGDKTPIGNKGSFVIQPGIDYALPNTSLSLFTNAIIAFDGYRSNNGTAASIQAGAGLRF
jgi:hypothetical protein